MSFWSDLVTALPKLGPGALGQVGGFFSTGSNTKIMQLIQQLHDDPTSAANVKTALIADNAPETVLNWVDAAAQAAANKDANGFANAIAQAKDAALHANGTFGNIGTILTNSQRTGGSWHTHFRR